MKFDPFLKTTYCPICKTKRLQGDHSACSKKLQAMNKRPARRAKQGTESGYMKSLDRYLNPPED